MLGGPLLAGYYRLVPSVCGVFAGCAFSWIGVLPFALSSIAGSYGTVFRASSSSAATENITHSKVSSPELSGSEIRERFLTYYESKGHQRLAGSSLVPEDPTVLLTIAGMLQFKPIFLGQAQPPCPAATTSQKCVRTNDIENVGVTKRHHTFFEMLGNFSFGQYFKEEACKMAWELATKVFHLPADRVWVSVYKEDLETLKIWRDIVGVSPEKIRMMGAEDNFWAAGPTGPCGPCTELYYDYHPERGAGPEVTLEDDTRFVEFYNLVFMENCRDSHGNFTPLARKCIDTGLGLERMAQILQGVDNNYETDLLMPILNRAASLASLEYRTSSESAKTALKIIGDHIRAVTYLISDGVLPSNVGRGYIVRRLLRRVIMKGRLLGIKEPFTPSVAAVAVELSAACDPAVATNATRIFDELRREELRFLATLDIGEKVLNQVLEKARKVGKVDGTDAFILYDTYGFPLEVTLEAANDYGLTVDITEFEAAMEEQRQRSKHAAREVDMTADGAIANLVASNATLFEGHSQLSLEAIVVGLLKDGKVVQSIVAGEQADIVLNKTPFYAESGGQIGDVGLLSASAAALVVKDVKKAAGGAAYIHKVEVQSGQIAVGDEVSARVDEIARKRACCNHTATHLLQAALKHVLGADTAQQGSLVEFDRLRFDFNLPRAMSDQEVRQVEALVNSWIQGSHAVTTSIMPIAEAKTAGAVAMFGEKYGEEVRVVDVPGVSMELCGGTHVSNTSEIGGFKILLETGIASGVRRIEAVAGPALIDYLNSIDSIVKNLVQRFKVKPEELPGRIAALTDEVKASQKLITELNTNLAQSKSAALIGKAERLENGTRVLVSEMEGVDAKSLQEAAAGLQSSLGDPSAVVLGAPIGDGKVSIAVAFSPIVVSGGMHAGKFVGGIAKICGGGGGGKPNLAQAGGKNASKLAQALQEASKELELKLSN